MTGRTLGSIVGMLALGRLAAAEPAARGGTAYERVVVPIFQARCVECHGEQKQKAKLALHTWEGLLQGSDAGPVIVAGKPDESVLLTRLRLPLADEEHMPPAEHPQPSPDEIALLAHWIAQGAPRAASLAELHLPEALAQAAEQLPARLAAVARPAASADPLWEPDAATVAKQRASLAAQVAELQRRFPGALTYESRTSPALHFTAAGFGQSFGDAELAALETLREQLVSLDISNTAVTDASAPILARCEKLRVLRAAFTGVGDATAQAVAALPGLELLALSDTKVTAASVGAWTKMKSLRSLRVADTEAQQPAQAANLPVVASAADIVPPLEVPKPAP